jgi:UDP-N-acetyl-2-amino-2-deoxyglucuronate dehydrogenase
MYRSAPTGGAAIATTTCGDGARGPRAKIAWPWEVYASISKANGFPERNAALENELTEFYESLPPVIHQGHTGQVDDVLTAIETGQPPMVNGYDGRKTIEIITAIYQSCITAAPARLPITPGAPFYTGKISSSGPEQRLHHPVERGFVW